MKNEAASNQSIPVPVEQDGLRIIPYIDNSTGLYNRHAFFVLTQHQLRIAIRTQRWLSLLLIKVNHLPWIKDAMGHSQCEQTLVDIADMLKHIFRNADIIAHLEEGEFAVLAIEAHYSSSHLITDRLLKNLEDYNIREKQLYRLTLSLGTAFFDPQQPCSAEELLARARATML